MYRFFILNYVIKNGNYFFSEQYAKKLQAEAIEIYLPSVDRDFDPEKIIDHLKITFILSLRNQNEDHAEF